MVQDSYAHLLIEVKINASLPDKFNFDSEKGNLLKQQVNYEWKLSKCDHCKMVEHTTETYRKNNAIRGTWVTMNRQKEHNGPEPQEPKQKQRALLRYQEDLQLDDKQNPIS